LIVFSRKILTELRRGIKIATLECLFIYAHESTAYANNTQ